MANFFDQFDEASTGGSKSNAPVNFFDQFDAPSVGQGNTPEQTTDAMSVPDKFTRAGIKGLTTGASGLVNTLGKTIDGADPKKLAKLQQLIGAVEERMGVDASQYAPASSITGDANRSLGERLANAPRSVVEMAGPALLGAAAGGLPGAVAMTTATTAGPTIDRKREALGLRTDQELPDSAKTQVGLKIGLDAAALAVGGGLTRGLMGPLEATGVRGLAEAGKRGAMATGADAALGAAATGNDKLLIEGQAPTASDLAVGAAQGAMPGLVAHAPGVAGKVPGAIGEGAATAREGLVNRTFRPLESLEPQSRGYVADLIQRYDGNFNAVSDHLNKELRFASKGLDDVTKEKLGSAGIKIKYGQRLTPEEIQEVSKADPESARVLQSLDSLSAMRDLEAKSLGNRASSINPFENFKTRVGDYALAHLISPKLAAGTAILQTTAALGAKGIDRLTGLSDPAKVITDRYAGTADPMPTIAEARAAAFARDLSGRQAKVGAAKAELDAAKAERVTTKLEGDIGSLATKRIKQLAKERKAESDALWKAARDSVRALNKRDDLQAREERRVDTGIRQQADMMRRSQAVEEARLASEQREADAAMRRQADIMRNSQRVEDQRVAAQQKDADAAMRRQVDLMRNSQSVEERRLANEQRLSDQQMARQAMLMRNSQAVEQQRQSQLLGDIGQQLRIMKASETASSSPAALPLAVARLKAGFAKDAEANAPAPEPTFNTDSMFWGPSSSIKGTPAEKAMMATRALERHNAKITKQEQAATKQKQKQEKEATQAKAEKRVKDAEVVLGKAKDDSNPDMVFVEHRGQRVEQDADKVTNVSGWKRQTKKNIDDRMDVIDAAKSLTKDKAVIRLLDQLAKNWNSRSKNDPDTAYYHLEDAVNDSLMPAEIGKFLFDSWRDVRGTWRMKKGYDEDSDE